MRILRVAQKCYPDVLGGGPYHVHAMSRDQAAMGHDVTVLTVDHDGDRPHIETRDGYTVLRYPASVAPLGNAISPGLVRFLRQAGSYDVVHAHSHLYFATNVAATVRRFGSTPLAITNHGLYSQNAPEWVFGAYLRTLGRWTFDAADVVFCYTDADRDRLRERGVSTRIEVVANGIDTARFSPTGSTEAVTGDPAILFVGRLVEGKRPLDALESLAILRERFPDATLTVCGDGPLRSTLERADREDGLESAVRFLGHVEYDRMPDIYRAADALVLPSRAEGLPRTVLEAMATDTPVVVSDLVGLKSVVDGGGETVPVGDVTGFADALATVLDSEKYDPRGAVSGRYDWAGTVDRTTAVLEGLTEDRP